MAEKLIQEKYSLIEKFLEEDHVIVHLITTHEGVAVPQNLKKGPVLSLKLSRFFQGEMDLKSDSISANLLFGANYFQCEIPFNAIWGITSASGKNILWPESAPREILEKITNFAVTDEAPDVEIPKKAQSIPSPALATNNAKPRKKVSNISRKERPSFLKRVK